MSARQIVLDTETTGLDPKTGHRIVEIGCIELVNRRASGRTLHSYLNPERDSEPAALAIHGLTRDFLGDKPKFSEIASDLCDFVENSELLIHNAPFDLAFLDAEFARLLRPAFSQHCANVIDTLQLAKELHPGKRNSLDALCERYGISNARRTLHGALLDAELLAEVYLAMTRGQESFVIDIDRPRPSPSASFSRGSDKPFWVQKADPAEVALHEALLDAIETEAKGAAVWRLADGDSAPPG